MTLFSQSHADSPEPAESVLGRFASFRGTIKTNGALRIDGQLDGEADAGRLTVGASGRVSGDLKGASVTIRGAVQGTVRCPKLAIEEGSAFNGRCSMEDASGPR